MKYTLILLLLCSVAYGQTIKYTINNGLQIEGVDATNAVIYDNDMIVDTPEMYYLWLKANRKEVNLVGNISSHNPHPQAGTGERQPALFNKYMEIYNKYKAMGGQNVPVPVMGSTRNVNTTTWENSIGSDLIISEAKKASPAKPLVIFAGGQVTTIANAFLKDRSIKDNIIVFHVDGWGATDFNAMDGLACQVLIDNGVKYINWDGNLNSWYNKAGSPMYSGSNKMPGVNVNGMPFNSFTDVARYIVNSGYYAYYGNIADAPPIFYFFNHSLWQNVARKNKSNQTITDNNFAFLLVSQNNWNAYGPQFSAYMNNHQNYIPVTTPIPPVNNPPTVTTTMGALFNAGDVTLSASASDSDGTVSKVEFLVNGSKVGEDLSAPYSLVQSFVPGSFGIQARAIDNLGAVGSSPTLIITVVGVTPPDSTDCPICPPGKDGKGIANTTVTSDGRIIITYTDGTTYTSQSVTGPPGVCPNCPGTGTGSTLRGVYFVENYGAVGNGTNDDTGAFQATINAANQGNGLVYWAPAPNFWNIKNTLNIVPVAGRFQVWMDMYGQGTVQQMRYTGPGNRPVFKIIGLKNSSIHGVHIGIAPGISGVQIFDILTTEAANSTTGVTFRNFYLQLGNGQDNIGVRTGFQSPGDISNYNFENVSIYGAAEADKVMPIDAVPGQYGYLQLGINTLSMANQGGFCAGLDRAYSNISRDGLQRGNGSVLFSGFGASHCNEDFVFAWEQVYKIENGRFELGNRFIRVTHNGSYSHVSVDNVTVHDYSGSHGNLIEVQSPSSLVVKNSTFARTNGGLYPSPITLSSTRGKIGAVEVTTSSFTSDVVYTKPGNTDFDIYLRGNVKLAPNFVVDKFLPIQ